MVLLFSSRHRLVQNFFLSFLAVCLGADQAESFLGAFEHWALRENGPNFDGASEFQARATFGDGQGFIEAELPIAQTRVLHDDPLGFDRAWLQKAAALGLEVEDFQTHRACLCLDIEQAAESTALRTPRRCAGRWDRGRQRSRSPAAVSSTRTWPPSSSELAGAYGMPS